MSNEENNNTVNEPQREYLKQFTDSNGMTITFFSSFEQENEYTYKQYAKATPEESLATVTRMRLSFCPYLNTNLHPWGDTIYFKEI